MTNVSITIDVENPQTPLFEKRFSDNRIWSDGNGIEKIIEILNKYGIKGSFFTNVYEYPIWGKSEMERIVKYIHDKGHDVELHTHPIWIDDKRRENMFQFTLREQEAIIQWGADFIETHTGRRPTCHRAGAYGFNNDTLIACKKAGLAVDSSHFFGHPNCKQIWCKNDITIRNGIVEFPVTYLLREKQIIKTDIDWMHESEFHDLINKYNDCGFINLFFHSYSLTETCDNFATHTISKRKISFLENILQKVNETSHLESHNLSKLYQKYTPSLTSTDPDSSITFTDICVNNKTKRKLIFINDKKAASFILNHNCMIKESETTTLREEVASFCANKPLKLTTPLDYGYTFLFYTKPFNELPKYENSLSYGRTKYQKTLNDISRIPLYENKNLSTYKDYSFYTNGDYNASFELGRKLFYPVDTTETILNALKPEIVISIDGDGSGDGLETYILSHYLVSSETEFYNIKVS